MTSDEEDKTVFSMARPKPGGRVVTASRTNLAVSDPEERTVLFPPRQRKRPPHRIAGPVLTLSAATNRKTKVGHATSNPLIVQATGILTLLGRLRMGNVERHAAPLRDHLVQVLTAYPAEAMAAGASAPDAELAQYLLAASCDDILRNVPDADPAVRRSPMMTEQFFGDDRPGVGFFTRLHRATQDPKSHAHVIELGLACLALGFEGQYRSAPDGSIALANMRKELHTSLRSVSPVPYPHLSKFWKPSLIGQRRRMAVMPMWMIAGLAAMMVVALFAALAWTLTRDAHEAQTTMLSLHDPTTPIQIARVKIPDAPEVVAFVPPPTTQSDRIGAQLQSAIAAGEVFVSEEGDFLIFRLGTALEFRPGAADLRTEAPIIRRIAAVLDAEHGPIVIEGHSDNIPLSGRGAFKTNEALSEARAAAVRDVLARYLRDPQRLSVVGVGAAKPLDRADTEAARARNRRVDILLRREERL
ncbi:MAG: OmpA family protein [Rhodobacteraceae bacterium]|nr:OmpA family protein [Paracoccaceae bacterium]